MTSDRPRVVLFVDDSAESRAVIQNFWDVDADVEIVSATGTSVPSAKVGNTVYAGRWGIGFLLQGLPKRVEVEPT